MKNTQPIKAVSIIILLNLIYLLLLENVYEFQGEYFVLGLIRYIQPIFISFTLCVIGYYLLNKIIESKKFLLLIFMVIIFISNEFAFFISEGRLIFFGLFKPEQNENIVEVNRIYYLFISISPFLAVFTYFLINLKQIKWRK